MYLRSGIVLLFSFCLFKGYSQDLPNMSDLSKYSPNTTAATQLANVPVDLFHGMPSISVPIFNYSKDNFGLGISLSYQPGGIKVLQGASDVGLGWYLQAGGAITRTVRGVPDDLPEGYLNAATVPSADFRAHSEQFYNDSIDTKQDVFNFNFCGRGGKFFIGRNGVITTVPLQNIRIIPIFSSGIITSFKIITEDGTQYFFADMEKNRIFGPMWNGYYAQEYVTSWSLSNVILPFSTDTVKFHYLIETNDYQFAYPQVGYYYTSGGARQSLYTPTAINFSYASKIMSIDFPGNTTASFYYDTVKLITEGNPTIKRIEISDTIFRRGFSLVYDSTGYGGSRRPRLRTVTPYFQNESGRSYKFYYDSTSFDNPDTIENARDRWGYYNGHSAAIMPTVLPDTVNRSINLTLAKANTLTSAFIPGTGLINYTYESNDRLAYIKSQQSVSISASTASNNTVTLNQVFNERHRMVFNYTSIASRTVTAPASSTGTYLECFIKSTDLSTTYASGAINIDSLFYLGAMPWDFNVPNGNYRLITNLASGSGTISGSFPIDINWENRTEDTAKLTALGGLRIKSVKVRSSDSDTAAFNISYKYIREDGKSSGFLGDIPIATYPYTEVNAGGTTLASYTVLASDPLDDIPGNEISPSYSRVEVFTGTSALNAGKSVYEYTSLKDVNTNLYSSIAPFTPFDIKDWAFGAPKKTILYDSAGRKVKVSVNNYDFIYKYPDRSNNSSLKLLKTADILSGGVTTNIYTGNFYSFSTGRGLLNNSVDSSFFTDGSIKVSTVSYTYDTTYYNVKAVTSNYNSALGLQLESRTYYPYDYSVGGVVGILRDSGIIAAPVANEQWLTGDGNPRLLNASIMDFQQLGSGQIRPATAYIFKSNKPVPLATIGAFDPAQLVRNTTYFKPATTYDVYDNKANLLQVTNVLTSISNCSIMDYGQQFPVAQVLNAVYTDIAYTGFESDGSGNWTIADTTRDTSNYVSGKRCYNIANGNITKSGLSTGKSYILTVWAINGLSSPAITVNGSTLTNIISTGPGKTGKWKLYSVTLTGISSVTVSGTGLIDELRLYPSNANMTSSTYEPNVGVTSTDNASNIIGFFEYDNLMRPSVARDKDHYIIKKSTYSDTAYYIPGQIGVGGTGTHTGVPGRDPRVPCPSGNQYKAVNGICETGVRHNTAVYYISILSKWECHYHYVFSDSSYSIDEWEYYDDPCDLD